MRNCVVRALAAATEYPHRRRSGIGAHSISVFRCSLRGSVNIRK